MKIIPCHRTLPIITPLYGPGRLRLPQGLQAGTIQAPAGLGHWVNRIHIDDAARACAHLLTISDPQPLYIGTDDHPLPATELYDELARMMKVALPAQCLLPPTGKRLSNARLRASGWRPTWPTALEWYAKTVGAEFTT
ncbi:MAG: SDR family NAD(P)-dependent oxidoreductase, partial [Burkholderiaceae bacterium]